MIVGKPVSKLEGKRDAVDRPPGYEHAYYLFKTSEARTRPTRVIFTKTHLPGTKLGTSWELSDAATGRTLGVYEIVGIAHFDTGYAVGRVPGLKLAAAVA